MCIIILQKQNNKISKDHIKNSLDNNPDGSGIAYVDKKSKKIVIKKYLNSSKNNTLDIIYNDYLSFRERSIGDILLHFRIATHGAHDYANTHPYIVNDNLVMAHNGIISGYGTKDYSDSRDYIDKVISPLVKEYGDNCLQFEVIRKLIEEDISTSKFVFLNNKGESLIFNSKHGEFDKDKNWYSNGTYKYGKYIDNSYYGYGHSFPYNGYSGVSRNTFYFSGLNFKKKIEDKITYQYQRCLDCNKAFPIDYPDSCIYCDSSLVSISISTKCFECNSEDIYCNNGNIFCRTCGEWLGSKELSVYDDEKTEDSILSKALKDVDDIEFTSIIKHIRNIVSNPSKREIKILCVDSDNINRTLVFVNTILWKEEDQIKYANAIGNKFGIIYKNFTSVTCYTESSNVIKNFIKYNKDSNKYSYVESTDVYKHGSCFSYIYKTKENQLTKEYGWYDRMEYWTDEQKNKYIKLIEEYHGVIYDGKTVKLIDNEEVNANNNNGQEEHRTDISSEVCEDSISKNC